MQKTFLGKSVQILLFTVLLGAVLFFGKPLFMPLAIAGMLAMLFIPCCRRLEKMGFSRTAAAIFCGMLFFLAVGGVLALLIWQIGHVTADISQVRENFSRTSDRIHQYFRDELKLGRAEERKIIPSPATPDGIGRTATMLMGGLMTLAVYLLLIWFYLITLLCLRHRFREFVLRLVPDERRSQTKMILLRSLHVVQQYLSGLMIVICCLWVLYGIGFSVIGIHHAIFFALLCGLLEIIPFVGNLTGSTLTSLMALSQGGGIGMVAAVLVTYAVIQFIQFYIISPLVMRAQLNINALFIILALIGGDLVWGIAGMILAIPLLGITRIVFDQVEALQPVVYLTGQDEVPHKGGLMERLRTWFAGRKHHPEGEGKSEPVLGTGAEAGLGPKPQLGPKPGLGSKPKPRLGSKPEPGV
jgi:predicted PurR-regulated permease PerM